jgi:hypothetical protein
MGARYAARSLRRLGACTLLGCALGVGASSATGASQTATYEGWNDVRASFAGRALIVSDAATVRLDPRRTPGPRAPGAVPFVYYRVEANVAELDRRRLRFATAPEEELSVRTSIGRMNSGDLGVNRRGGYVLVPGAPFFTTPVVYCCNDETETVIESRSQPGAPRPVAGSLDGPRVRWLAIDGEGALTLNWANPENPNSRATVAFESPAPANRLASMGGPLLAYASDADRSALVVARVGDEGAFGARTVTLPGRIIDVAAERSTVAVALKRGSRFEVRRLRWPSLTPVVVWRGGQKPNVAVGRGTVGVAAGKRAFASRSGRLKEIRKARGLISEIAVDGSRAATLERRKVKGKRATIARLARVS